MKHARARPTTMRLNTAAFLPLGVVLSLVSVEERFLQKTEEIYEKNENTRDILHRCQWISGKRK